MHRGFAWGLLIVGLTLMFMSPLLRFYVAPHLQGGLTTGDATLIATGRGSYFSLGLRMDVESRKLERVSVMKEDRARSTRDVAVMEVVDETFDRGAGLELDVGAAAVAFDRRTGVAVACCRVRPVAHGLVVKFPVGTTARTYLLWDGVARRAFAARYRRTEELNGLKTLVFASLVPATVTGYQDVPAFLVGKHDEGSIRTARVYEASTDLWVEPATGAIVKTHQRVRRWLQDSSGQRLLTTADMDFVSSAETIQRNVRATDAALGSLRLIRFQLPIAAPIVGGVVIALGWRGLRREERQRSSVSGGQDATPK
jgi:hypothetical protein